MAKDRAAQWESLAHADDHYTMVLHSHRCATPLLVTPPSQKANNDMTKDRGELNAVLVGWGVGM